MPDIKRTGGAYTDDLRNWTVTLNGVPPREWQDAFYQPHEYSQTSIPKKAVKFHHVYPTFPADESHVAEWIKYIDMWITHANEEYDRVVVAKVGERRAQAEKQTEEHRRKIDEANERFKNL